MKIYSEADRVAKPISSLNRNLSGAIVGILRYYFQPVKKKTRVFIAVNPGFMVLVQGAQVCSVFCPGGHAACKTHHPRVL